MVFSFCRGSIEATLVSMLPVLLIVGTLNYLANGWNDFGQELITHWQVTAVPLALCAVIGGIVGVIRR